jgi:hypothetical protein
MRGTRRAYFLCISLFMMGGAKQCEFSVAHWSIEMGSRSILLRKQGVIKSSQVKCIINSTVSDDDYGLPCVSSVKQIF